MNGFLLVARMTMDDLPLRFFATEDGIGKYMLGGDGESIEDVVQRIAPIAGCSASDLIGLDSIEFRDGQPVECKHLMNFA